MALTFDKIPSVIEIPLKVEPETTVAKELESAKVLIDKRIIKCSTIEPLYKQPEKKAEQFLYRFFCVCPRYQPNYLCKHSGNIVIDRDILTKAEHLCYLAQPRENYAAPRKHPHYYQKKVIMSNCTTRIEELAKPDIKRVQGTIEDYFKILPRKQRKGLMKQLERKPEINVTPIDTALKYINEERRLKKVANIMEKRRCKRIKKDIIEKQRRQIKKIICVLFEEMKDFLLNDQFVIDERSTLCTVILEQIRIFTDKEFYTTSNLREYQHILANNLTVWINKFISNLNIHVAAQPQPTPIKDDRQMQESYLPVNDYISYPNSYEEECLNDDDDDGWENYGEEMGEEHQNLNLLEDIMN